MKKFFLFGALIIVLFLLSASLVVGEKDLPSYAAEEAISIPITASTAGQTGVWVSGEGKVTVVPDVAVLRLGVESEAVTVAEAQRKAAEAMNKVMSALKANGVKEKDIQTQWFNISPIRIWNEWERKEVTIGYRVNNMVAAKIRNLDKTGVVIDAVAEAGGDFIRIEGVSFLVENPSLYYDQAREKALKNAMAKAKQMAEITDIKLGKVVYITETFAYIPQPVFRSGLMEAMPALPTPISPGEMEITITVQMVYAIR